MSTLETFGYYKESDCGKWGKALESSIKLYFGRKPTVSKQGKIDFIKNRKYFEIKSGAGELDYLIKSKVKFVVFVPVVNEELPIDKQEGFILKRTDFLDMLNSIGLVRSKISTAGTEKVTIQTYWNHSKNKPHGAKYFTLLDKLYDYSLFTLEEYFTMNGKFDVNAF